MNERKTENPEHEELREMIEKLVADQGGALRDCMVVPRPVEGSALRPDGTPFPYVVHIEDCWNFASGDNTYVHGGFETADEALAVCRFIVHAFVDRFWESGMDGQKTYDFLRRNGFDPWIVSSREHVRFDTRDCIERRVGDLIAKQEAGSGGRAAP